MFESWVLEALLLHGALGLGFEGFGFEVPGCGASI